MAIQSRERLKGYFKKGAYPTEGEFGDLIESMRHRGEEVPLAEVAGLAETLNRKLERSEAGVLRDLLDGFRGLDALAFSGIDHGEHRIEEGAPGRIDTTAALNAGFVEVWFSTVEGRFLLRLGTTAAEKYFALWGVLEGAAGVAAESAATYGNSRLFVATASGRARYYTWDGDTKLRELGDVSDIKGALDDLETNMRRFHSGGVLTGAAPAVEHKARSAKIVFETMDPAGRRAQTEAVIGAVGIKAGLMLPEQSEALKKLKDGVDGSADLEIGADGALGVTERAKRAVFDDLWRHAWDSRGGIDEEAADGRRYLGNELAMTYKEALEVLTYGKSDKWVDGMFSYTDIRTNIPHRNFGCGNRLSTGNLCGNCLKLEVFVFHNNPGVAWQGDKLFYTFSNCRRLRAIKGMWKVDATPEGGTGSFSGCAALEEIEWLVLGPGVTSLPLADSPLISRESLAGIISRSLATRCVITLHADPYAKVCGDTTNAAAAALTAAELAEWMALADAAAGKNITFARN